MIIMLNFFRRLRLRRMLRSDVTVVLLLTVMLILVGTFSYARIEGWRLLDALYATIITITTVGYGDFSPQTVNGRLFAIFFTFFAIGIGGYAISTFAASLIENRAAKKAKFLRKRRMKRIEKLNQHYILCGADLLGTRIAEEFQIANTPFLIIEPDETKLKSALLFSHPDYYQQKIQSIMDIVDVDLSDYESLSIAQLGEMLDTAYILDDPTDDNALVRAAISRAAGLIAAMPDDRDNLAIVVGARALAKRTGNTALRIMSRVEESRFVRKLYLSGADYVRIPAVVSGQEMAMHMMHPEIGNWWYKLMGPTKTTTARMQQISMADRPDWVGMGISDLHEQQGFVTMAVKRAGEFVSPPQASMILTAEDLLIVLASSAKTF